MKTVPAEMVGGRHGLGLIESELSCGVWIWGHSSGIHDSSSVAFTTTNGRHSLAANFNGDWPGDPAKIIKAEYCGKQPGLPPPLSATLELRAKRAVGSVKGPWAVAV
ncbi:hypothetical protein M2158_007980 [Streptomyces sp. SAI-144]|uniref:hypothetical protein n=1 Tax=Streptomyces sp. SAI-144 TaxID=2940544 RepID=UPI002475E8C7|nr:hypothetical protein [Streptomyces sp. SAI-144]MDH6439439.1 hypothetical protein [Streptomyces sp. SAI-144]